jgi:hypothetical protein
MSPRTLGLALAALALAPLPARAQSATAVAVGVTVTTYDPSGELSLGSASIGPVMRLRTGPGTGPAIGFDWYSIFVNMQLGDRAVPIGEMRVRPFMGGLAYTVLREPYAISLGIAGGAAVTGIHVDGRAREAYARSAGARAATITVSNSLVWRSQLSLWYDVTGRIGLNASVAYISAHPRLILATERGVERRPISASPVVVTFGVAYGVF